MLTCEEVVSKQLNLTKADENLLKLGGALTISVAEVGGKDPEAPQHGGELDRGANKFEGACYRLQRLDKAVTLNSDRKQEEIPVIRNAVFGVAEAIRFIDRGAWEALPVATVYEKQDPVWFIDRCLSVLDADPTKFGPIIGMMKLMRARLVDIDSTGRQLGLDRAEAKHEYEVSRTELQKVVKAATVYVLKHSREGSPARLRLKKKIGKRQPKPQPTSPPASTAPATTPATAPAPAATTTPATAPDAVASIALTPAAPAQPAANTAPAADKTVA